MPAASDPACIGRRGEGGCVAYGIAARSLLDSHPGPALVVREGAVIDANRVAEPIAACLARGEPSNLIKAIGDTLSDRRSRQLRVHMSEADGGTAHDLTLLWLAEPYGAILVLGRDVTLERNLTQALLASRELFKDLVSCSSDFAWETDATGRFRFVSPRGALGYSASDLVGRLARDLLSRLSGPFPFEADTALEGVEVRLSSRIGEELCFEVSSTPVFGRNGVKTAVRGVCRDVTAARARETELARAHARLEQLARVDDLTGLLNRRAFIEDTRNRMSHIARHGRESALLYLDLDNFKRINDHHGHHRGDEALKFFAGSLQRTARAGDLVARLGGDEFVLWLEDTGEGGARAKAAYLAQMAEELNEHFAAPGFQIGLSVGIVVTKGRESVEKLIEWADEAMYGVKRSGKGACAVARAA